MIDMIVKQMYLSNQVLYLLTMKHYRNQDIINILSFVQLCYKCMQLNKYWKSHEC